MNLCLYVCLHLSLSLTADGARVSETEQRDGYQQSNTIADEQPGRHDRRVLSGCR